MLDRLGDGAAVELELASDPPVESAHVDTWRLVSLDGLATAEDISHDKIGTAEGFRISDSSLRWDRR